MSAGQLLNDSIVQALCRIRPSNVDAFRRVPGVPGLVADSPAQEYVDAIISFCSVKGYPTDVVCRVFLSLFMSCGEWTPSTRFFGFTTTTTHHTTGRHIWCEVMS